MKSEPTDIDREAAEIFTPAPGMRVRGQPGKWGRVLERDGDHVSIAYEGGFGGRAIEPAASVECIDVDDMATVGAMLAQVDEATGPGDAVDLYFEPGWGWRTAQDMPAGDWRGDALVLTMRELKGNG